MDHANTNKPPMVRKGDFLVLRVEDIPTDEYEETLMRNKTENERTQQKLDEIRPQETFNRFFCDAEKTKSYDDTNKYALLKKPLFIQLCVQASKNMNDRAACFHELVTKIKNKDLLETQEGTVNQIAITNKDLCHRLLSFIPTGYSRSLINGKSVQLLIREYETQEDKIKNAKIANAAMPEPSEWAKGFTPAFYYYHYSGKQLLSDHDFQADITHHQQILAEYNKLLGN